MPEEETRLESSYKTAVKELEDMVSAMKQDIRKKYSRVVLLMALLVIALAALIPGSYGFIIVTLGEALAIYGLIVSILIWISF